MSAAPDPPLWRVAAAPATVVMACLLATAGRYGLHGDELYFRMLPLSWWYVDQPPLTVWLTHLTAVAGDATWVQRVPAVLAAGCGVLLAASFPRLLGHPPSVQRVAAWAHGTTVYPLIVGHVFLTSTLDLLAWQALIWCVLAALLDRPRALTWAGVVAGLACWNKLLVLVLVAALGVALLVSHPRVLRSADAARGALCLALLGGPQVVAQAVHGWPMSSVSSDLIALHGDVNRLLVVPLLVAFLGPPLLAVWWRGLRWRPPGSARPPVLAVAGLLLLVWTLLLPAQPYYPFAAFLPALAIGWGIARADGASTWVRRRKVVTANAAVAAVVALPLVPVGSAAFGLVSAVDPVARDQAGWPGYVEQVARARGGSGVGVVTDSYALAGAVHHDGWRWGIDPADVASGHNGLWELGPPRASTVLLVGPVGQERRGDFERCEAVGALAVGVSDPFGIAGASLVRCSGPRGGWEHIWPRFRRLGG